MRFPDFVQLFNTQNILGTGYPLSSGESWRGGGVSTYLFALWQKQLLSLIGQPVAGRAECSLTLREILKPHAITLLTCMAEVYGSGVFRATDYLD